MFIIGSRESKINVTDILYWPDKVMGLHLQKRRKGKHMHTFLIFQFQNDQVCYHIDQDPNNPSDPNPRGPSDPNDPNDLSDIIKYDHKDRQWLDPRDQEPCDPRHHRDQWDPSDLYWSETDWSDPDPKWLQWPRPNDPNDPSNKYFEPNIILFNMILFTIHKSIENKTR